MACAAIGAPVCGFAADTYTRRVGCRWPAESLTRMLLRYPLVALVRATRWAAIEGAPGFDSWPGGNRRSAPDRSARLAPRTFQI